MRARIVILPDGRLSAFIEDGSYEQGKAALEKFIADLGADGIEFAEIGTVEQHRHDTQHATTHVHQEH